MSFSFKLLDREPGNKMRYTSVFKVIVCLLLERRDNIILYVYLYLLPNPSGLVISSICFNAISQLKCFVNDLVLPG